MPPQTKRRSPLMRLMRLSPGPLLLAALTCGALMLASLSGGGWQRILWDAGSCGLVLCGALFAAVLWGGVYLMVVEASRGLPGLRAAEEPAMTPEVTAAWEGLRRSLSALGFRQEGWFSLDDFDETHVSAWGKEGGAAFVLFAPMADTFRLRLVSKFENGTILLSSTRLTDLTYPPPPGVYVQVRKAATVEELWAWHFEGERLFPKVAPACELVGLYGEVSARWGRHRRSDPTWFLAVEPFEECWRMYRLCGVSVREQIERGWVARG